MIAASCQEHKLFSRFISRCFCNRLASGLDGALKRMQVHMYNVHVVRLCESERTNISMCR